MDCISTGYQQKGRKHPQRRFRRLGFHEKAGKVISTGAVSRQLSLSFNTLYP